LTTAVVRALGNGGRRSYDRRTISRRGFMSAVHEPKPVAADPTTLPYAYFTSPASLQREQAAIFERSCLYVTHTGALQHPGDYVTARVGKVPLVLTPGRDVRLCESVQRGISSETFSGGRLMLRYEHSIKHFRSLVRAALAPA
jgi:phenylpropionate dioxygenase-like ring-hydroxylating dioxygenase large terminal subunit